MPQQNAKRDDNHVTTLLGVDSLDLVTPQRLAVDSATNRLLVTAVITSSPAQSVTNDGTFLSDTQLRASPLPVSLTSTTITGLVTTKETKSATNTTATVAGSGTVVPLIASNTSRLGATIYNDSSALLYLKLGATASLSDFTVVLAPLTSGIGGYYEVPFGFTGIITGIWASATGNARVGELT